MARNEHKKYKKGFYLLLDGICDRCYYISGQLKGNKWIDLDLPEPEWWTLSWTCRPLQEELDEYTFSDINPLKYKL